MIDYFMYIYICVYIYDDKGILLDSLAQENPMQWRRRVPLYFTKTVLMQNEAICFATDRIFVFSPNQ